MYWLSALKGKEGALCFSTEKCVSFSTFRVKKKRKKVCCLNVEYQ